MEKTKNMVENSNVVNATANAKGSTVADIPLLDLSTPVVEVSHNKLAPTLVNE